MQALALRLGVGVGPPACGVATSRPTSTSGGRGGTTSALLCPTHCAPLTLHSLYCFCRTRALTAFKADSSKWGVNVQVRLGLRLGLGRQRQRQRQRQR